MSDIESKDFLRRRCEASARCLRGLTELHVEFML